MAKPIGFCVFESSDDYEQGLALRIAPDLPSDGILTWCTRTPRREGVAVFGSRAAAKAAITRTEHYRLAFGRTDLPEKQFCVVVPIVEALEGGSHG